MLWGGNIVRQLTRIKNIHESRVNRFKIALLDVIEAERDADGAGEEFVAISDSCTYSQGYPSDTDVRNATGSGWIDLFYVLISLVEKTRPVVRAYRISDYGEVAERFIGVFDGGSYTSGTTSPGLME